MAIPIERELDRAVPHQRLHPPRPESLVDQPGREETLGGLEQLWKEVVNEEHGRFVPDFTAKQRGQLEQFVRRCPKGEARPVLETCLREWIDFTDQAESGEGAFKSPGYPEIRFLLKYIFTAANFHRDKVKRAAEEAEIKAAAAKAPVQIIAAPPPSLPVKTKPTKPQYPEDDPPATYEEVMEILGIKPPPDQG